METDSQLNQLVYESPQKNMITQTSQSYSPGQKIWMLYSSQPQDLITPIKYKLVQTSNKKYPVTQDHVNWNNSESKTSEISKEQFQQSIYAQPQQDEQKLKENPELNLNFGKVYENGHFTSRHQFVSYFSVEQQQVQQVLQANQKGDESTDQPKSIMLPPKRQFILKDKSKKVQKYNSHCSCLIM